jgi:hypothetical protein
MTDLTQIIPCNPAGDALNALYDKKYKARARLGMSEIGHECNRYLWYKSHGIVGKRPDARILRLFELGNVIETHIIQDLLHCGFQIENRQTVIRIEQDGHKIEGHSDGVIVGHKPFTKPHLLEIKTAGEKTFKDCKKKGYQDWNQKYKAQIHTYMTGFGISRCLVIVYNKNTSEIYSERIRLNPDYAESVLKNIFWVMDQSAPPLRICPRADWYKARWCDYYKECFK